jgi:hypothetical protein
VPESQTVPLPKSSIFFLAGFVQHEVDLTALAARVLASGHAYKHSIRRGCLLKPQPRPTVIAPIDEEDPCRLEGLADDLDGGAPRLAFARLELMDRDDADPGLLGQLLLAPA